MFGYSTPYGIPVPQPESENSLDELHNRFPFIADSISSAYGGEPYQGYDLQFPNTFNLDLGDEVLNPTETLDRTVIRQDLLPSEPFEFWKLASTFMIHGQSAELVVFPNTDSNGSKILPLDRTYILFASRLTPWKLAIPPEGEVIPNPQSFSIIGNLQSSIDTFVKKQMQLGCIFPQFTETVGKKIIGERELDVIKANARYAATIFCLKELGIVMYSGNRGRYRNCLNDMVFDKFSHTTTGRGIEDFGKYFNYIISS